MKFTEKLSAMALKNLLKLICVISNLMCTDLLPENQANFDPVPYHVHFFVGCILTILGVLGSLVCIGILHLHKKLARFLLDPSGVFMVNFLATNLFVVLLQVPFSAVSAFSSQWIFGDLACQIYASIGFVVGLAAIFSLALLVFDLWMHVEHNHLSSKISKDVFFFKKK